MGYMLALAKVIRCKLLTFMSLSLTFILAEIRRQLLPSGAPEFSRSTDFLLSCNGMWVIGLVVSKWFLQPLREI
jgi:hypothetical protein